MNLENLSIGEIKKGYEFNEESKAYICSICQKKFEVGEVFQFNERFFEARRGIELHIEQEHGDRLQALLSTESKYNTLTDNQKEILSLIYSGMADKEIAKQLSVSPSTIRHQKFTFREKAKQAKLYLAIYEQAMEGKALTEDALLPIHEHATMVDDRYLITEKERTQILETVFESMSPLKLKTFPPKEKKKLVALTEIAKEFQRDTKYSELEINKILKSIYHDHVTLRRYLISYGFMDRTDDGKAYWLK